MDYNYFMITLGLNQRYQLTLSHKATAYRPVIEHVRSCCNRSEALGARYKTVGGKEITKEINLFKGQKL